MEFKVGVIAGDGIGPEVTDEAWKVLEKVGEKFGHTFHRTDILMGGCSIDATGEPLTDEAIETAKDSIELYQKAIDAMKIYQGVRDD